MLTLACSDGRPLHYLATHQALRLANDVFRHDQWSSEILEIHPEFRMRSEGVYDVYCWVRVQITLRNGAFRQDIGAHSLSNQRDLDSARENVRPCYSPLHQCMLTFATDHEVRRVRRDQARAEGLWRPTWVRTPCLVPSESADMPAQASACTMRNTAALQATCPKLRWYVCSLLRLPGPLADSF